LRSTSRFRNGHEGAPGARSNHRRRDCRMQQFRAAEFLPPALRQGRTL